MIRLDIEIVRNDRQSVVLEWVDADGQAIDPAAFDRTEMWVKPAFKDRFAPELAVRPADASRGLGPHLEITFTREMLEKQMWCEARYGIETTRGGDGPKTLIGGKIVRIY